MLYRRQAIIKWTLYGLLLWIVCVAQISLPLRAVGVHALPLLPLAAAVAVFEGPRGGAAYGFIAGLLCGAFTPGAGSFYAIYLLLTCLAVGSAVRQYFRVSFVTALVWSVAAHAGACLLYFLFFILIPGKAGPQALLSVALPEILLTLPYAPLVYMISKGIHRRFAVKY